MVAIIVIIYIFLNNFSLFGGMGRLLESTQAVQYMSQGRINPSPDHPRAVCEHLGVTLLKENSENVLAPPPIIGTPPMFRQH